MLVPLCNIHSPAVSPSEIFLCTFGSLLKSMGSAKDLYFACNFPPTMRRPRVTLFFISLGGLFTTRWNLLPNDWGNALASGGEEG